MSSVAELLRPRHFPPGAAASIALGVLACMATFFMAPLMTLLVIVLVSAFIGTPRWRFIMVFAAVLLFVIINVLKAVDGDLLNYLALQEYFQGRGPDVLLNRLELTTMSGSYRISEIGFYLPSWILANLIPAPRVTIAVLGTLAVYLPVVAAMDSFKRTCGWDERMHTLLLLLMLMGSLNFVQSTHLLRQYISAGIGLLAFARFLESRPIAGFLLIGFACSIHNALAPVAADMVAAGWLMSKVTADTTRFRMRVLAAIAGVVLILLSFAVVPLAAGFNSIAEEMQLKVGHYVFIGGLLFVSFLYSKVCGARVRVPEYALTACSVIFVLSLGFFLIKTSILALRYYAYLEWFLPLLVAPLVGLFPPTMRARYLTLRWAVCAAAIGNFVWRVGNAPWLYGPGEFDLFSANADTLIRMFGE